LSQEVIGERDLGIVWRKTGKDRKGEVRDTSILFNRWHDQFNLHKNNRNHLSKELSKAPFSSPLPLGRGMG
jgi:hypothetical protein